MPIGVPARAPLTFQILSTLASKGHTHAGQLRGSASRLTCRCLYDIMHNMRRVTVRDLQHNLADLLDQVQSGQELVVTKRGKAVARIVPAQRCGGATSVAGLRVADEAVGRDGHIGHLSKCPH